MATTTGVLIEELKIWLVLNKPMGFVSFSYLLCLGGKFAALGLMAAVRSVVTGVSRKVAGGSYRGLVKNDSTLVKIEFNTTRVICKDSAGVEWRGYTRVERMRKPIHGQKKKDLTLTLTPDGIAKLEAKAQALNLSKSELVERMAKEDFSSVPEQQLLGECLTT